MRRPDPIRRRTTTAHADRLRQLGAVFAAFRRGHRPGQWIPRALRALVVNALDEGVPASALREACGVSSSQLARWRTAAQERAVPSSLPQPRVLSVVDAGMGEPAVAGETIEIRVGPWQLCLSRAAD